MGTDIGVSCTKKSYGRGVGKIPLTCRADEDLNGLLCYPKCKKGFKSAGCCLCSKNTDLTFKLKDVADAVGDVFDAIYDIPVLGWILEAFDAAIEAVLTPILDAIPGIPKPFDLPSINIGELSLGSVPFEDAYEQLLESVQEIVEKVKEVTQSFAEKLPSDLPTNCPEIAVPMMQLAKQHFAVTPPASRTLPDPFSWILTAINKQRKCPTSSIGMVLKEGATKMLVSFFAKTLSSKNNAKKKMSTKRNKKKLEEKAKVASAAGFKSPRMVITGLDMCTAEKMTKSGRRGRRLEKVDLGLAFQQSAKLLPGARDLADLALKNKVSGYFVQRLDMYEDGGVRATPTECIWTVELIGDALTPRVVPYHTGTNAVTRSTKAPHFHGLIQFKSANFHLADMGISGFYYIPRIGGEYRAADWAYGAHNCAHTNCPSSAGCRRAGTDFLIPRTLNGNQEGAPSNTNGFIPRAFSSAGSLIYAFNNAQEQGIPLTAQNLLAYRFSVDRLRSHVSMTKHNAYIAYGPYRGAGPTGSERAAAVARMEKALSIAQEEAKNAIAMVQYLRNNQAGSVPGVIARLMRLAWGLRVLPGVAGHAKFGLDYVEAHAGVGLAPFRSGMKRLPVYPKLGGHAAYSAKLRAIQANYQIIYNYLKGERRHVVLRQSEDNRLGPYGYAHSSPKSPLHGNIHIHFFKNEPMASLPEAAKQRRVANTIIHESSHALFQTEDYFYWIPTVSESKHLVRLVFAYTPAFHAQCVQEMGKSEQQRGCEGIRSDAQCPLLGRLWDSTCDVTNLNHLLRCPSECSHQMGWTAANQLSFDFDLQLAREKAQYKIEGSNVKKPVPLADQSPTSMDPTNALLMNADSYSIFTLPHMAIEDPRFERTAPSTRQNINRELVAFQRFKNDANAAVAVHVTNS